MDGFLIILGLALIMVTGHFLWLALVALIRFLSGTFPLEVQKSPARKQAFAPELNDLEITRRTIQQLLARGDLDEKTAQRVSHVLEARYRALQPEPVLPVSKPTLRIPTSSLAQLEQLLSGGVHPRELPLERRREALACYRGLNNSQRTALNGPTLLAVARLLELAGMTSHALNAYRRWLDEHPELPDHAVIALESARLAVGAEQFDLARRFLRLALRGVLPEPEYADAQHLALRLENSQQPPASRGSSVSSVIAAPQEVPEVIPMQPIGETPVPPAFVQLAPAVPMPSEPPAALPAPPRPRRSLTTVLAAFMEERNILWGELTGGLLIVGCSIALVITLWQSLESLPYFPFLIFTCITASLFSAGEYTLHHWQLQSTSRGLLVIALLLVPLNLLVLADPELSHADTALEWIFKSAAIVLSLGMVWQAGRDVIGVGVLPGPIDRRWLFLLAIVGTAGSVLLVSGLLDEEHPVLYIVQASVPVACHVLACGAAVTGLARGQRRTESKRLEVRQASALFVFLGLSSFTLLVALGFLLSRSMIALALPRLAEPLALASVPILAGGLLVWRGLPTDEVGSRTAGTAIAFTGLAFMLSAVALAWPQPLPLLLVCLSNAVLVSFLAFYWRMPSAHAVALPCLTLTVLLVVHLSLGHFDGLPEITPGWQLAEQLAAPESNIVLALLMILCAVAAEGLARLGQRLDAASYAIGSTALGAAALLTTTCHGIAAPWPAAAVHGLVGTGALALHTRWTRPTLSYGGVSLFVAASLWVLWAMVPGDLALWGFVLALESALLAMAVVRTHPLRGACRDIAAVAAVVALGLALFTPDFPAQEWHTGTAALLALTAFVLAHTWRFSELAWLGSLFVLATLAHLLILDLGDAAPPRPLLMALLAHATLALGGTLLLPMRDNLADSVARSSLQRSALVTSLLAVLLLLAPGIPALVQAGYALWLAVLWLLIAGLQRSPAWFSAFQLAVCGAVAFAVSAWLPERAWYDPDCLQTYGIALAVLALGWVVARIALVRNALVRQLWVSPLPSLDRVILGALVVGQFALALWGILPGLDAEMTPVGYVSSLEWPSTAAHASGWRSWELLGVLAIVLLTALREKGRTSIVVGLLVLAITIPLLMAGAFASQLATASALRWGLAVCYLACSAGVWLRRPLARLSASAGVKLSSDFSALLWSHGFLAFVAFSLLLMTAHVAVLSLFGLRLSGPAPGSLFAEMGWTVSCMLPLLILTLGLIGHALRERAPVYAFLAVLIVNLSVTGGYALAVVTSGRHPEIIDLVRLWQLGSLMAGLGVLAWMMSLPWLRKRYGVTENAERIPSPLSISLMMVQVGIALGGQFLLLGQALLLRGDWTGSLTVWAAAAGSLLGWASLLASMAALSGWYWQQRRPLPWGWLFTGGLAVVSLMVCTVEHDWPGAGCNFLLLAWPLYVLLWSSLLLMNLERYSLAARTSWLSFAGYTNVAAVILLPNLANLLWALQVAIARSDYLWAAAAVTLCAAAAALLALARRNDKLAFLAGLGANLASSLVIWRLYAPSQPSWIAVIQANAIASSSVTLAWLAVRSLLAERRPSYLLALQARMGLVLHTAVLLLPLLPIALNPGVLPIAFLTSTVGVRAVAAWASG